MKILQVHNRYRSSSPSGEDRVVEQERSALEGAGHVVESFERFSDDIASAPVLKKALVPFQVVWSDSARRSVLQVLHDLRPDVVHVHNTFPLVSPSILYACRSERVPVVATIHNYGLVCASGVLFRDGVVCHDCLGRVPLPAIRHGCYRESPVATVPTAVGLVAHRRAWRTMVSAYVFPSNAQRDVLATDNLPRSRLFVKPNFVLPSTTRTVQPEDMVVYAGRLTETKGLPVLMEAWDRYASGGVPGLRLAIAGAGPLEARVATWSSSHDSVTYEGLLDKAACAALVARARAAVIPSMWEEPFGLVAVEAMAVGVPPIASRRGSFEELITDGVDGVLFKPGDSSALASLLDDIGADPCKYEALGRAAYATHQRRFSVEANVRALERIYTYASTHPR